MTAHRELPDDTVVHHNTPAERYAVAITIDYVLRTVDRYSKSVNSDVVDALIAMSINRANTQHIRQGPSFRNIVESGVAPDQERRPVNVKSIADSLGLPYETVRRRVNALLESGYCARENGGVIIPKSVVERDEIQQIVSDNYRDLVAMVTALNRAGFRVG